ncbi:response regulator [Prosthecobacter sp.]|uniref:hybrid sensor histidine kinase/response regulator n=1 Tax=Prosthecobacter sp. TaxID=1965333 RepID=UPI0024870CE6|nr:response regulator [Prosthecobacter sp.]MDI1313651.1 response regulator [Prosthecobacter sp.]
MTNPTIKFLLVDDLEANLDALEGLLHREGLELLKARSGAEALELLLLHDVDLALLDVNMAEMDGFELAELMRGTERTRRVPIIFLTAGAIDPQRRFRGYEAGAVDFIFKPIEPHILQNKADIFFELAMQREILRRSVAEAQAANRAKDHFMAALSHELRTPLTPVLMAVSALQHTPNLPTESHELLDMMRRNIELEARLIDDLLDATSIHNGKLTIKPAQVDVHELLQHCQQTIDWEVKDKQFRFVTDFSAPRHHVLADPVRLQQVFLNLLKNAIKFTPVEGSITIRTFNPDETTVGVQVEDTGVGISPQSKPRIFDAFEQGDAQGQTRFGGLGLGLSISKAIVEAHGGAIEADSLGADRGSTFTVTLSIIEDTDLNITAFDLSEPVVAKRSLRLLVVEDHAPTREILGRLLTRNGHHVVSASSVAEALAAFKSHPCDAVITDLGLPDGSGLDLMRALQQHAPIIGIALSGYGMEADLNQSKKAGFRAHLTKPIQMEELLQILSHVEC